MADPTLAQAAERRARQRREAAQKAADPWRVAGTRARAASVLKRAQKRMGRPVPSGGGLGELTAAFTPRLMAPKAVRQQAAAESIRTISRVVKALSQERGVSELRAGEILRATAKSIERAQKLRARLADKRGKLSKEEEIRALTGADVGSLARRSGVFVPREIAQYVVRGR